MATLKADGVIRALAFSPDGKWLAIATIQSTWHPTPTQPVTDETKKATTEAGFAQLIVFDVPGFTPKFTAKVSKPENGFIDLAWATDSKVLLTIDSSEDSG